MSSGERQNYLHNKAEGDYKKGKHDPPHGIFDEVITWSQKGMQDICDDNKAYQAGWQNAKSQDKK